MENPGKLWKTPEKAMETIWKTMETTRKTMENTWKSMKNTWKMLDNYGKTTGNYRKTLENYGENDGTMEHSYFEKQKYLTITHQRDVSKSPYLLNDMCRSQLFFETWLFIVCRSLHVANSLANFDFGSPSGSMNCPSRIPTY